MMMKKSFAKTVDALIEAENVGLSRGVIENGESMSVQGLEMELSMRRSLEEKPM